jgi:hypothetical protein
MKYIDYLYFNIYSHLYRISLYKESSNTRTQAMYLFSIGFGGWLLLFEALYLHLVKHARFASRGESTVFAASLYMLTAILSNYFFIVKDRDQKILGKYEELADENPKRKRHLIISVVILLLPYMGLLFFAIFFPRHNQ